MSATLETRAEIIKLARLLDVSEDELEFLRPASAEDLVVLREQLTDSLYSRVGPGLQRLAAAAKLVPAQISAAVAQRAMGPLLCARLAGLVDAGKAVEIARHLPPLFLTEVAIQVDPRRAKEVIGKVPAPLVREVAKELGAREEHVTMGRFVGYVSDDAIRTALGELSDSALLQVAFVMEGKERLDQILGLLPAQRVPGILRAADDDSLWSEALDLLQHLSPERTAAIGDLATGDEELLDSLARAAAADDLWDSLLPIVPLLSEPSKRQIATMAGRLEESLLEQVITAVQAGDLWSLFVPLAAEYMDDAGRARVASIVMTIDQQVIFALADAVERDKLWPQLLKIAEQMNPEQLEVIADRLLGAGLEDRLPSLLSAVEETGLWETGLQMLASLPEGLKQKLAPVAATLTESERQVVLEHARGLNLREALGAVFPDPAGSAR
jgi:hypothetical protein